MKIKVKNPAGGDDLEVELPPEFVSRAEVTAELEERFEANFGKRAASIAKNAVAEAMKDPKFKTDALKSWGIDPTKPAPSDNREEAQRIKEELDRARSEWDQAFLGPVKQELESTQSKLRAIQDRSLTSEIVAAATAAGVKGYLLKSVDGGEPPVVAMTRSRFGYDDESGNWYVKKGDRFAVSATPTDDRMYQNVTEYFSALQNNKEYAEIFEDRRQRGPGMQPSTKSEPTPAGSVARNDAIALGLQAEKIASGELVVPPAQTASI